MGRTGDEWNVMGLLPDSPYALVGPTCLGGPIQRHRPQHRGTHRSRSNLTAALTGATHSRMPRCPDGAPRGWRDARPSRVGGRCLSHQRLTSRMRNDHEDTPEEISNQGQPRKQCTPSSLHGRGLTGMAPYEFKRAYFDTNVLMAENSPYSSTNLTQYFWLAASLRVRHFLPDLVERELEARWLRTF